MAKISSSEKRARKMYNLFKKNWVARRLPRGKSLPRLTQKGTIVKGSNPKNLSLDQIRARQNSVIEEFKSRGQHSPSGPFVRRKSDVKLPTPPKRRT